MSTEFDYYESGSVKRICSYNDGKIIFMTSFNEDSSIEVFIDFVSKLVINNI